MARSPFKQGLFTHEPAGSAGRYRAAAEGEQPAPPDLVDRLMKEYFLCTPRIKAVGSVVSLSDLQRGETGKRFRQHVERMKEDLSAHVRPSLQPNAVLEAIIARHICLDTPDKVYCGLPLTLLVQSFFELGYNDFVLDFSLLDERVLDAGNNLTGRSDERLNLTIRGRTNFTGIMVRDCSITGHGEFYHFGYGAYGSGLELHGSAVSSGRLHGCVLDIYGRVDSLGSNCWETDFILREGSSFEYDFTFQGQKNTLSRH